MQTRGWRFHVRGIFLRDGVPARPCEAIIESGNDVHDSPFRNLGVGPKAEADVEGRFSSWFITQGSCEGIKTPETVSIFLRIAKDRWAPLVVSVSPDAASATSNCEMRLNLGEVRIASALEPYVRDA
jgi:hypothetical protein